MSQEFNETVGVTLRETATDDEPFLFRVYASTREEEMAAWGWSPAQQDMFLRMQFRAWQQGLLADASATEDRIIIRDGQPIGRIVVIHAVGEITLADIALLPEHRGTGIGSTLIQELQGEAARDRLPLRLHVAHDNRAARLYHRLGFVAIGDTGVHIKMEWLPQ